MIKKAIDKEQELDSKYGNFVGLLLEFLEDGYYPERTHVETIVRFTSTRNTIQINRTLSQAQEVLYLDPFPYEWIRRTSNRFPSDKEYPTYDSATSEDYYKWVQWMVEALTEEAKKQGKL